MFRNRGIIILRIKGKKFKMLKLCTYKYSFLSSAKVAIVLYRYSAYEKRINLTCTALARLVDVSTDILLQFYRVEEELARGWPVVDPYLIDVSMEDNLAAVVTPFKGKGTIHLGTRVFAHLMKTKAETDGVTISPPEDQGRTIPWSFLNEQVDEMHGRIKRSFEALI